MQLFFVRRRHSPLMRMLVPSSLLLLMMFAADVVAAKEDKVGHGDHKIVNGIVQVDSKWTPADENSPKIEATYGDCASDIKVQKSKIVITYKQGSTSAKTGCTFDLFGQEFLEFKVKVSGPNGCLMDGIEDIALAGTSNAVPFVINAVNPREKGLCFDKSYRYECQKDDKRDYPPCGKGGITKSLCQEDCLRRPFYEMAWARKGDLTHMHMTMVGDPQYCIYTTTNGDAPIDVKFGEDADKKDDEKFFYTIKGGAKGSPEAKYGKNYRAFCLDKGTLPKSTKSWEAKMGGSSGRLNTLHLMPQNKLFKRQLPKLDYSNLKITQDNTDGPKCEIIIEMEGAKLLVGAPSDKRAPCCGCGYADSGSFGFPWWLIAAIVLASLLIFEIIGFLVWLYLVRWRKSDLGDPDKTAMTEVGVSKRTTKAKTDDISGMKSTKKSRNKSGIMSLFESMITVTKSGSEKKKKQQKKKKGKIVKKDAKKSKMANKSKMADGTQSVTAGSMATSGLKDTVAGGTTIGGGTRSVTAGTMAASGMKSTVAGGTAVGGGTQSVAGGSMVASGMGTKNSKATTTDVM